MDVLLGDMLEVVDGLAREGYPLGVMLLAVLYLLRNKVKRMYRASVGKVIYCHVTSRPKDGLLLVKVQVGGSAHWLSLTIYWTSKRK